MGANSDSDDYVLVGTPIEQAAARHKAAAAAGGPAAVSRAPPVWQQAATDEQGRRRFHGAFTGGFSAGYYNTVGSKEGWAPSTFRSSRDSRAQVGSWVRRGGGYLRDGWERGGGGGDECIILWKKEKMVGLVR